MGWYHYQCAEDGTCDVDKPIPCPDGTCQVPDADSAATASKPSKTITSDATEPDAATTAKRNEESTSAVAAEKEELYIATTPIYHLCQERLWVQAVQKREPYFPPTFWSDGRFTRASCERSSLVETANHYYKDVAGDWLCLELDPVVLRQTCGTPMAAQRAPESLDTEPIQCLKVYGGISTTLQGLVLRVFRMQRRFADGTFTGVELDESVPKQAVAAPAGEENAAPPAEQRIETNNNKKKRGEESKPQEAPKKSQGRSWWKRRGVNKN